jgi:DNA-binding NtrC family response regulator
MSPTVLALIENSIGTKLILTSRLQSLGYEVTTLSDPDVFRSYVESRSYDWIILDAAAVPTGRGQFLRHLQRHYRGAHVVWCGPAPPASGPPIAATFAKPLRYDHISRFFAEWVSPAAT